MKKFLSKNWWLLALLFILTGTTLGFIGWSSGAGDHRVYIDRDGLHVTRNDDKNITLSKTDLAEFVNVNISTASADVELIPSDHYGIDVSLPSRDSKLDWDIKDGELRVTTERDWGMIFNIFNFNFRYTSDYYVKVYYPKNITLDNVQINTTSGDIRMNAVSIKNLSVEATSGDIQARIQNYDIVTLNSTSGDIRLNGDFESIASIRVEAHSGDINMEDIAWRELVANTTSGDIIISGEAHGQSAISVRSGDVNLRISGGDSRYSYNLSATSGDIRVNGQNMGNSAISAFSSDNLITIETTSGDINLEF
jgi:hypothetical protein